MKRGADAFSLVEFVVAIVFVGVVLGPLLVFVSRVQELGQTLAQQSAREGWRTFNEQALAHGIEPAAPALAPGVNAAIPELPPITVIAGPTISPAGVPVVVPLQGQFLRSPESRLPARGYRLGAAMPSAPRGEPQAPLPPIVLSMPVVSPVDGAKVRATELIPTEAGQPHKLLVRAEAAADARVALALNQPLQTARDTGTAWQSVSAAHLLSGVAGRAWAEFSGDSNRGDRAIELPDGRVRWVVRTPSGRRQIYEPSAVRTFRYYIDLGPPILRFGSREIDSGGGLEIDYGLFCAIAEGRPPLQVDFPAVVKEAFGAGWPSESLGFHCTFGAAPAPFNGSLKPFFSGEALSWWSDETPVAATAVAPAGAVSGPGMWRLSRKKTPLGVPRLSSLADGFGFYQAGVLLFAAPPAADGTVIGRLSFNYGAWVSTGPTLSIEVGP